MPMTIRTYGTRRQNAARLVNFACNLRAILENNVNVDIVVRFVGPFCVATLVFGCQNVTDDEE